MIYIHFDDFAHNVGQWIILNHVIMYDETIRSGIHRHILLCRIKVKCKAGGDVMCDNAVRAKALRAAVRIREKVGPDDWKEEH